MFDNSAEIAQLQITVTKLLGLVEGLLAVKCTPEEQEKVLGECEKILEKHKDKLKEAEEKVKSHNEIWEAWSRIFNKEEDNNE